MNERWSDWIEHDGHGFPVPTGTLVHRQFDHPVDLVNGDPVDPVSGYIAPLEAKELECWLWVMPRYHKIGMIPRVIRYRVRRAVATHDQRQMAEA